MHADSLIEARWIIPVEPTNTVHEDHAIVIKDGKIAALLPVADARAKYKADEEIVLDNHVLIPGLINAHTHAAMNLFRGLGNDLPLMEWLNDYIWPAEKKWLQPDFVQDGTALAIAEMIRGGTTCFNDMYFFPDHTAEVAHAAGIRAVVGLVFIGFPTAWAADADEYLFKGEEVHDTYRHNPLISTAFAPHAPYTVPDEMLARIGVLAEELDIPIHMHIHETATEVEDSLKEHGKRPLQRVKEAGVLNPRLCAVHMTQLDPAEIKALSKQKVSVIHCPESNLKLASGFCPVADLHKAKVNVCIGTDGAASNNDLDMIGELRTAALLAKAVAVDCTAVDAHTVLAMGTINAAKALGLGQITGSLKKGKQADITAINLNQLETVPLYAPVEQVIYAANRQQVTNVWVAGQRVLADRELTTLDYPLLMEKAQHWQKKISG